MESKENETFPNMGDAVVTIPQGIIPKLYENPRQVAYSYLNF